MGIVDRTQAVIRSNFNALLSRFEEPGRDIAWLLNEMKEQLQGAQRELIRVVGERKRSETRLTELTSEIERWEKRAELAVRHGDDALAREAVRANVRASVDHLRHGSETLEELTATSGLRIVGAEYSLETGLVEFHDEALHAG